ncbi:hypothetical protein GDN83_02900 [Gordonia jinghuaiqii]|uniref:AMIN-like domain-containing protein n=1 Tax=Gordonia jinghuaiqii TaxID=2758710 RepID=A0A7D7QUI9_9ACTN|nr:hypothetical protein [Gordonia jinghuaiqii]MCR5976709.1 hypothetical protein [Gordonia jinghuaiqii]QMS99888.1 hypothetical protein H1R19_12955 [Gordonia jinghuaiqii]
MGRARNVVGMAVAAVVVAGCSTTDSEGVSVTTVSETVTSTAAPSEASATSPGVTDGVGDAGPKTAQAGQGARLTVTDIRTGVHPGFDRVVYELDGTGSPGWRVSYVDDAVQMGSGFPVEVAGNAILEVEIGGSAYPFDTGVEPYDGPDPVRAQPGGSVVEVRDALVFEGVTQSFIGVAEPGTPFRVSSLTTPTRLVIDVQR